MEGQQKIIYVASNALQTAEHFRLFGKMLEKYSLYPIVIVGSSTAETKKILEGIVEDHQRGDIEAAMKKMTILKTKYYELALALFDKEHSVFDDMNDHFVSIEWDLEESKHENVDYAYDQTVAVGELLSTLILATYLQQTGLDTHWMDARDLILTDDVFRNANVMEAETKERVQKHLIPLLREEKTLITQAVLGCTTENYSIILGQENGMSRSVISLQSYLDANELLVWNGTAFNKQ